MMWHAVSAHIPLEEQSKPRAWLTIGIAAKLSFETPTIAALQESVTLRANCEAAYDDAVLGELFRIGAGGVAVRQRWDADVEMPTTVVAGVHALVLDNPQQAAVLGVTGCPYCIQPNRRRAFFGRAPDTRSKANMQPVLMAAHDTMQNARGPRDLEMRVAKKNLARLGLRWPPKPPVTYLSYLQIQPYHVSAYLNLHNLGLCMRPNTAQLILQFLFDEMGGQRAKTKLPPLQQLAQAEPCGTTCPMARPVNGWDERRACRDVPKALAYCVPAPCQQDVRRHRADRRLPFSTRRHEACRAMASAVERGSCALSRARHSRECRVSARERRCRRLRR